MEPEVTLEIGGKVFTLLMDTAAMMRFEEYLSLIHGKPTSIGQWAVSFNDERALGISERLNILSIALAHNHRRENWTVNKLAATFSPRELMTPEVNLALIEAMTKAMPQASDDETPAVPESETAAPADPLAIRTKD